MQHQGLRVAVAVAGFVFIGCGPRGEEAETRTSAITTPFTLPIVVGLSPNDIVIGATGAVSVNDFASVAASPGAGRAIAAIGATGTTNIGVGAAIDGLWSRPGLLLRRSSLSFYKTQGSAQIQAGTTFADATENRTQAPIRQDPIWTVTLSAPTTGAAVNECDLQPTSLAPGNYGATTVCTKSTLVLNAAGSYGFVSLDLEPGSTLQIASPAATTISVNSSLILRAQVGTPGTPGLVFAYLGTSTAHVEAGFFGDLFLAPRADIEIKANSTGHFFGQNVTQFENVRVTAPALSVRSQDLLRPTEQVRGTPFGELDKSAFTGAEMASAVLTPALNSSCPSSRVFWSTQGPNTFYRSLASLGSSTAPTPAPLPVAPAPPPPACIGSPVPGYDYNPFDGNLPPEPDLPLWTVLPGGAPFYSYAAGFPTVGSQTDMLAARLPGGRVLTTADAPRFCLDPTPPQGAGCPTGAPANGAACSLDTQQKACFYGSTQCVCSTSCLAGGAACTAAGQCCSGVCNTNCTTPAGGNAGTWQCGPLNLNRFEGGLIAIRMSADCGTNWTAGAFDFFEEGVPGPGLGTDRPEMYEDPFDDKLYVSARSIAGLPGSPQDKQVVYAASTAGLTNASLLSWQQLKVEPWDAAVQVVTTVLDEKAILPGGSTGRWVHVVRMRCANGAPLVDFLTPFGAWSGPHNLAEGNADRTASCAETAQGTSISYPGLTLPMPFFFIHGGPSIAGVSSTPPRVRVAYTGVDPATKREIINVYSVTLRSANAYLARPTIVRELVISDPGRSYLWPQLIAPDNLAGSSALVDTPVVLRYAAWGAALDSGDTVQEIARVLYSGLAAPELNVAQWRISVVGGTCTSASCFAGDYRYGGFYQKTGGGTLSFFTPWSGQPSTTGATGFRQWGALVDVTP